MSHCRWLTASMKLVINIKYNRYFFMDVFYQIWIYYTVLQSCYIHKIIIQKQIIKNSPGFQIAEGTHSPIYSSWHKNPPLMSRLIKNERFAFQRYSPNTEDYSSYNTTHAGQNSRQYQDNSIDSEPLFYNSRPRNKPDYSR